MKRKALIISIKGINLTKKEKILISNEKPWGVILFKRNFKSYNQTKKLISQIKLLSKNKNFPIIVDEEGLNVSRLKNIINHNINSKFFGDLYGSNKVFCMNIYRQYINSLSKILNDLGININSIPVLDVLRKNTNKVIGGRAFSKDGKVVKKLGLLTLNY